jgi:Ankyrin repeat
MSGPSSTGDRGGGRVTHEGVDPQLEVSDLGPGLWLWRVLHPGWTEDADWQPIVTSTCVDLGPERLLVDPLVPPPDASPVWDRLDARPPTAVAILIPDHVRPSWRAPADYEAAKRAGGPIEWSVDVLVRRYGCAAYGPATLEPAAELETPVQAIAADMVLPGGAVALPDPRGFQETPLWLPEQRVLVFADALTERNGELRTWTMRDIDGSAPRALRALLRLPFERVIISHGEPVHSRAEYERALQRPPWPGTPLHLYAWKGDLETVRELVTRGDDIDARDDDKGRTVLDWARGGGHRPVIDYLVSIGATASEPGTT